MTDRYEDGVRGMRDVPVPDQWDEIVARAGRPAAGSVMDLAGGANGHGSGRRFGRSLPMVLAVAASVAVVVGAVALVTREDADVATAPTTTTDSSGATTSLTTETAPTTTTTSSPPGRTPGEVVDLENYPVSACSGLPFATDTPPGDIAAAMQDADRQDPRVPTPAHGSITGVFPGATSTRAVFMVVGWPGLQDDAGTYIEGPFPGVQSWIAPYDDGWLAEIAAPASAQTYCPFTVIGLGLGEAEMRQFLGGLTVEG